MRGITRDTLAELIDRKVLIVYGLVTIITSLVIMAFEFDSIRISVDGARQVGFDPVVSLLNSFVHLLIFITVMASAGLLPSMVVKGRIDFYLSRPISRASLYLNRLFSVWIVYGGLTAICAVIVFTISWLKTDMVGIDLVYLLAVHLAGLLVWLSITFLAGIATGSTPMTIIIAFCVWVAQSILQYQEMAHELLESELLKSVLVALYHVVPKTGEISTLAAELGAGRQADWMPLWSSMIVAFVLILAGLTLFKKKSY